MLLLRVLQKNRLAHIGVALVRLMSASRCDIVVDGAATIKIVIGEAFRNKKTKGKKKFVFFVPLPDEKYD